MRLSNACLRWLRLRPRGRRKSPPPFGASPHYDDLHSRLDSRNNRDARRKQPRFLDRDIALPTRLPDVADNSLVDQVLLFSPLENEKRYHMVSEQELVLPEA